MMHVYPVNDLAEHETTGTQCACNPRLLVNDPDTGEALSEMLVVHNSFDGRELIEEAERIKDETFR